MSIVSFIANLKEIGMLNQANVFLAPKRAGKALAEYAKIQASFPKLVGDGVHQAKLLLRYLMVIMPLAIKWELRLGTDEIEAKIFKVTCKFYPKGVGGAELEETLCPYLGLPYAHIGSLIGDKFYVELIHSDYASMLQKPDGCRIKLKVSPR